MKANELRIGNLIQLNPEKNWYPGGDLTIVVNNISDDGINYSDFPESGLYWQALDESIVPIPLDDRWLIRFGFKKVVGRDGYYWELNPFRLGEAGKYFIPFGIDTYSSVEVTEVHNLQNLYYYLTGQELTIK